MRFQSRTTKGFILIILSALMIIFSGCNFGVINLVFPTLTLPPHITPTPLPTRTITLTPPFSSTPSPSPTFTASTTPTASLTPTTTSTPEPTATEFVFDGNKVGTVERNITYCKVDGVKLKMDVYYPYAVDSPLPAVMYVHGGSWRQGDKTTGAGTMFIEPLRKAGYLVVSINYRLSPRYKFPAHIQDVRCAVRHLRAEHNLYGLDPDRIGALGDSAGGHLVSLQGVSEEETRFNPVLYEGVSSAIRAVVDLYGPVTEETFCQGSIMKDVFGVNDCGVEIIRIASPLTYLTADDPPLLIIHGEKDQVVSIHQSLDFMDALQIAEVPADMIIVKNAGHSFTPSGGDLFPSKKALINMVINFFNNHL